jgi:hypothetical protein
MQWSWTLTVQNMAAQPLIPVDDCPCPMTSDPCFGPQLSERRILVSNSCRSLDHDQIALVLSPVALRLEPSEIGVISDLLCQLINFVHCP